MLSAKKIKVRVDPQHPLGDASAVTGAERPPVVRSKLLRAVCSLVLFSAGLAILILVLFHLSVVLGWAVVAILLMAVGASLSYDNDEGE